MVPAPKPIIISFGLRSLYNSFATSSILPEICRHGISDFSLNSFTNACEFTPTISS